MLLHAACSSGQPGGGAGGAGSGADGGAEPVAGLAGSFGNGGAWAGGGSSAAGGTSGAAGSFPNLAGTAGVSSSGGAAGAGGELGDGTLIVPPGLTIRPLEGGNGVLNLIALTLQRGSTHTEVYAALRNDGQVYACSGALSVELFDHAEQSLAAGIGGLHSQRLYRIDDELGNVTSCVAPGDVTMAAVTELPAGIAIDEVGLIVYRCPYFELQVEPFGGLTVMDTRSVSLGSGIVYTGTLVNALDVAVTHPSVTVFPLNRAGRPLAAAVGQGDVQLEPGDSWVFQTNAVPMPGSSFVAFPAAALVH